MCASCTIAGARLGRPSSHLTCPMAAQRNTTSSGHLSEPRDEFHSLNRNAAHSRSCAPSGRESALRRALVSLCTTLSSICVKCCQNSHRVMRRTVLPGLYAEAEVRHRQLTKGRSPGALTTVRGTNSRRVARFKFWVIVENLLTIAKVVRPSVTS